MADTEPKKRVRRTKEEAQRVILDAAEERLANGGPEALRLQDIAADVGISHPAILHHFESRDGLVLALSLRTLSNLREGLIELLKDIGVLGIFRPKTTRIAESPAIRGLPGGITFPEPVNIPRLCASVPPDPVVFHSFRRYRYPSS
ncbi:MAG: helix-turn-helix transcriptional regulator [Spongiibacter sp.]|uniref:TetR/AcrR family transcriptional regulator n=2 Tax=Spongiibacter TaxID=630749 RepID=UPI001AFDEF50|nr:helix-turn-helix transcriptional regulator [Spongiibacter sp.]